MMIIGSIQEIPSNLSQLVATTVPQGDKSSKLPQNLSCHHVRMMTIEWCKLSTKSFLLNNV